MTRADFNHLLDTIKSLPSEQALQLRQQLDKQLAQPKKPTPQASAKTVKRVKAATQAAARPLSIEKIHQQMMARGLIIRLRIPPSTPTMTTRTTSPLPSTGSRCRKRSSANGADGVYRLRPRFQRRGQALRPGGWHRLGARSHCAADRRRPSTSPTSPPSKSPAPLPAAAREGFSPPQRRRHYCVASASTWPDGMSSSK